MKLKTSALPRKLFGENSKIAEEFYNNSPLYKKDNHANISIKKYINKENGKGFPIKAE